MERSYDAVVVGAGPNGLAAGIRLAQEGLSVLIIEANETIGGGSRSVELTLPGFVHDVCSAIHPMAAASPFFRSLELERHGLEWVHPELPLAHPLEGGRAAVLARTIDETSNALGRDGASYRKLMAPFVESWEDLVSEILGPILHAPKRPILLGRFGLAALQSAEALARRRFESEEAKALFAGVAAHSFLPLDAASSSAIGIVLAVAAHSVGWPMPRGGAQAIAGALERRFRELGGEIETDRPVRSLKELPDAKAVLLDLHLRQFIQLAGDRMPTGSRYLLERYRNGPGVFKVDYALSDPAPWLNENCAKAGTVHLGGTMEEIAASERAVAEGRHHEGPFVLVAEHSRFDPSRAPLGKHTLWAYCHVPNGSMVDMTDRIENQIERFAPGFRDCILERHTMNTADLEHRNRSLIGGDINGGRSSLLQLIARPTPKPTPYRTPLDGIYLCSASTPPGGGVHGMCGFHAAEAAIRDRFR